MGSTLKAITEGRYAMSFGRGSAEHWKHSRPAGGHRGGAARLPHDAATAVDRRLRARARRTGGQVAGAAQPAWPGRWRPAARTSCGRAEDDGARRRALRLRRHAHLLQRAGDDKLDRGRTPGGRARWPGPRRDPYLVVPGRRTGRPLGRRPAPSRGRPTGDLLPGVRRHVGRRSTAGTPACGRSSNRPRSSSRQPRRAARSTPPPTPRPCSGSPSWSPTSGSRPRPTAAPRTRPAPSPASSSSAATR